MNIKCGTFFARDSLGNAIKLEWEEIIGQTDYLTKKIKSLSPMLVPSYTETEVDFARKKPEEVANDFMLKSLAQFVQNTPIDWGYIQDKISTVLTAFFENTDWEKYTGPEDINIFISAFDVNSNEMLGVIQFIRTPSFEDNEFKAALFGVSPSAWERGIELVLMSAIFNIVPDIKRIFLHTRTTNEKAISLYKSWGFNEFGGNLANWTDLEYLSTNSTILQQ